MESSRSFKARLSWKLGIVFTLIVIIAGALAYYLYQREAQHQYYSQKVIPDFQTFSELNRQYMQVNAMLDGITLETNAKNLAKDYQQLISQVGELQQLTLNDKSRWQRLANKLNAQQQLSRRISEPAERNELLRNTAQLQLQLVLDTLRLEIEKTQQDITELHLQIAQDNISDKVTVSRSKTYIRVIQLLHFYQQSYQVFDQYWLTVNTLNIYASKNEFEQATEAIKSLILLWTTEQHRAISGINENSELLIQINNLNGLLFGEQNTVAKWRGQLRLSAEFFELIKHDKTELMALGDRLVPAPNLKQPQFDLVAKLKSMGVSHPFINGQLLVALLFSVIFIIGLLGYWLIRRDVAREIDATQGVLLAHTQGKPIEKQDLISEETAWVHQQLLQRDESALSPQELNATIAYFKEQLARHQQFGVFTIDKNVTRADFFQFLAEHTGIIFEPTRSWRSVFTKDSLRQTLALLKESKNGETSKTEISSSAVHSVLVLTSGQEFELLIQIADGNLIGSAFYNKPVQEIAHSLSVAEEAARLKTAKLHSQHSAQVKELYLGLERLFIQNQQKDNTPSTIANRFNTKAGHLYSLCQQQRELAVNQLDRQYEPKPFCLDQCLNAVVANKMALYLRQKHRIIVAIDASVKTQVNSLYHELEQVFSLVIDAALEDHLQSMLVISLSVKEESPEQQQLHVAIACEPGAKVDDIPTKLQSFSLHTSAGEDDNLTPESLYWQALQKALKIQDVEVGITNSGYECTWSLPLVIVQQSEKVQLPELSIESGVVVGDCHVFNQAVVGAAEDLNLSFQEITMSDEQSTAEQFALLAQSNDVVFVDVGSDIRKQKELLSWLESGQKRANVIVLVPFKGLARSIKGVVLSDNYGLFNHVRLRSLIEQVNLSNEAKDEKEMLFTSIPKPGLPRVELLFACPNVDENLNKIRLLRQTGLYVTLVTEVNEMLALWRTGRFSLLASAFSCSPFVELNVGKTVVRGLIPLDVNIEWPTATEEFAHWQIVDIPDWLSVKQTQLALQTWLSEPSEDITRPKPISESPQFELTDTQLSQESEYFSVDFNHLTKKYKTETQKTHEFDYDDNVFDIVTYTKHQGSPELAVLMLDEYLADIERLMENLSAAVSGREFEKLAEISEALQETLIILGAKDFLAELAVLFTVIEQKDANELDGAYSALDEQHQCFISHSMAL